MRAFVKFALLAISGGLTAAAVCWPFSAPFVPGQPVWALQWGTLAVLIHFASKDTTAKQAFASGLAYASPWMAATFWWMYVAMHTYGGLPAPLAAAAVFVLALALGSYYAVAVTLHWHLGAKRPAQSALLFAALWTVAELARGTWLSGFAWGATAYAHTAGPLALWAPIMGVYGVGFLAAWVAGSLVMFKSAGLANRIACVALLGIGVVFSPPQYTQPSGKLTVSLLQGNIPQDEKFEAGTGIPLALQWYAKQMQQSKADLVLAPETAIPVLPQQLPPGYWDSLSAAANAANTVLMTGIPLGNYERGYTNSVVAVQPGASETWRYDKHHLVPFGEFIPPLFKWFTRMMNIPLGDFNRGDIGQASFAWKGQRIAPNICYEDLFGEELGARFRDPAMAPTVFANVSNLGWFGDTTAIDQHLQISRMRALEFQRPFIRATNTGTTAIMDHQGRITHSLPRTTQGVLVGDVEGRSGMTPYAWWVSRFGLWPIWLIVLVVIGWAWRTAPRR